MAVQRAYDAAMRAVVDSARVDPGGPPGERVAFDQRSVGRVIALAKEPSGMAATKAAWRTVLSEVVVVERDPGRGLALLAVRTRVLGSRDRRLLVTPDGLRPETWQGPDDAEEVSWLFGDDHS